MKTLLLDIETAPHKVYCWGLFDQNIGLTQIVEPGYTLCWAAKWLGSKEMTFLKHTDKRMLPVMQQLLEDADAVVHYNGTRFDMPTLNGEFIINGLARPSPYKQIDLLRTARRQFRLASNKLDYVATHLGLRNKEAHKGMALWTECMAGDAKAWRQMEKYNRRDVTLLEEVYKKLLPWIDGHPNQNMYGKLLHPGCTKCGSPKLQKRGFSHTSTVIYQRLRCMKCGSWMRERKNLINKDGMNNVIVEIR